MYINQSSLYTQGAIYHHHHRRRHHHHRRRRRHHHPHHHRRLHHLHHHECGRGGGKTKISYDVALSVNGYTNITKYYLYMVIPTFGTFGIILLNSSIVLRLCSEIVIISNRLCFPLCLKNDIVIKILSAKSCGSRGQ